MLGVDDGVRDVEMLRRRRRVDGDGHQASQLPLADLAANVEHRPFQDSAVIDDLDEPILRPDDNPSVREKVEVGREREMADDALLRQCRAQPFGAAAYSSGVLECPGLRAAQMAVEVRLRADRGAAESDDEHYCDRRDGGCRNLPPQSHNGRCRRKLPDRLVLFPHGTNTPRARRRATRAQPAPRVVRHAV